MGGKSTNNLGNYPLFAQIINANLRKNSFQLIDFLLSQRLKPLESLAFGKQWAMLQHLLQLSGSLHGRLFFRVNGKVCEAFPNVMHCLLGGMHHVLPVETVVAQLIQENFVGWEIMRIIELLANLVDGKQQRGLAELVLMQAIFQMTQWRYGKDKPLFRVLSDDFRKTLDRLLHR